MVQFRKCHGSYFDGFLSLIGCVQEDGSLSGDCSLASLALSPYSTLERRWVKSLNLSSANRMSGKSCFFSVSTVTVWGCHLPICYASKDTEPFKCAIKPRSEAKLKLIRDVTAGFDQEKRCTLLLCNI